MVVQLTISTAILNFDFHRTLAENLETALAGIDAARADGGNTGKRVEEETTTIVTDEEAPEKKRDRTRGSRRFLAGIPHSARVVIM